MARLTKQYLIDHAMTAPRGTMYINIGTEKVCLFIHMSLLLLNRLTSYPLLHPAVEEALECASEGHFAAGILCYSQILNLLNVETPNERHGVAHQMLMKRPTQQAYDSVVAKLKVAAERQQQREVKKADSSEAYYRDLMDKWSDFMASSMNERGEA
jgi:hypothetical protein